MKGCDIIILVISKELKNKVYTDFINFAINKSDAVMLVVQRHMAKRDGNFVNESFFENLDKRVIKKIKNRIKKMEIENEYEKIAFYENTEKIMKALEPYLIKIRHNPTWPATTVAGIGDREIVDDDFDICIYRSCVEVKNILLKTNKLYEWIYPNLPEDLTFFKNNRCWFVTCSHEKESAIFTEDEKEVDLFKKMGIKFCKKYSNEYEKKEYNFEQY